MKYHWETENAWEALCGRMYVNVTASPDDVTCLTCKKKLAKKMALEKKLQAQLDAAYARAITIHPVTGEPAKKDCTWVKSVMNGAWVQEPIGLPYTLSVGSETYWSM